MKNFSDIAISKACSSVVLGLSNNQHYNNPFDPKEFKLALININQNYTSLGNDSKDIIIDILYFINEELLGREKLLQLNNKLNKCNKILLPYYPS